MNKNLSVRNNSVNENTLIVFKVVHQPIGMTKSRWNLQAIKITLVIKLQTSRHHTYGSHNCNNMAIAVVPWQLQHMFVK
jgi:hypothetical protein